MAELRIFEDFCIPILWNFDKLNINYDVILSQISKMISKPTRPLDHAIIKFTSAAPALDYAMIKLWRYTHDNVMRNAYNVIAIFRSGEQRAGKKVPVKNLGEKL